MERGDETLRASFSLLKRRRRSYLSASEYSFVHNCLCLPEIFMISKSFALKQNRDSKLSSKESLEERKRDPKITQNCQEFLSRWRPNRIWLWFPWTSAMSCEVDCTSTSSHPAQAKERRVSKWKREGEREDEKREEKGEEKREERRRGEINVHARQR